MFTVGLAMANSKYSFTQSPLRRLPCLSGSDSAHAKLGTADMRAAIIPQMIMEAERC